MSRISSLAANANLIQRMLRTQQHLFDLQYQVNTQKKSQDYAGISRVSERLINMENSTSLLNRYVENNERAQTRLNVAASAVEAMRTSIRNFQKELITFKQESTHTEAEVNAIQGAAFRALRDMEDMLNTDVDGRYIFGGGKSTTQPVNFGFSSIAAFQAAFDGAINAVPTTREAHLEEFAVGDDTNNRNVSFIDGSNFLQFRRDSDGDGTDTGSSTIRATSDVFSDLSVGSTIEITNTTSNNGTYTVTDISDDGTTITVETEMLTDETVLRVPTDENPAGTVDFLLENDSTVTSGAGTVTFDRANRTIVDTSGTLSANVSAGEFITISGTASNNGTVQVQSVAGNTITLVDRPTTISNADGSIALDNPDLGNLTFSRSNDTITAANAGAFTGLAAGDIITVSGTDENDGTYTIASNDGTTITIESSKLTDEGLSGSTFFNYLTDTDLEFTNADSTIEIRQSGTATAVADVFTNLQVGDQFTVTGTVSNDGTYTIASIAADGSSVTVDETLTDETFVDDGALAGVNNNFAYNSGTQMDFVDNGAGANTIQIQDSASNPITGVFSNLTVGEAFTVSGTDADHNGTYTITAISGDGSQVTVAEAFPGVGGNLTDTDGAELEVFGAGGTITANSYFNGDQTSSTHRVDKDREFEFDITAASPAFEKAIRAMKIILQGEYGTEGGLDQNTDRIQDALYLLASSLQTTVEGTPPYGEEADGSIVQVEQDIGFNQHLIETINKKHTQFIGFLEASTADVENADPLEAITKLLDEERALQASYQSFARIRQLSLTNFL